MFWSKEPCPSLRLSRASEPRVASTLHDVLGLTLRLGARNLNSARSWESAPARAYREAGRTTIPQIPAALELSPRYGPRLAWGSLFARRVTA
jgi:hypothetical protein